MMILISHLLLVLIILVILATDIGYSHTCALCLLEYFWSKYIQMSQKKIFLHWKTNKKVHPGFINAYLICIGQLLCINTITTMVTRWSCFWSTFRCRSQLISFVPTAATGDRLSCVLSGKGTLSSFLSAYDTSVQSQYFCLYRCLCIFHNYLLNFTYFKIYMNLYFII